MKVPIMKVLSLIKLLGIGVCRELPFFYSFTGCDSVESFNSKGKCTFFDVVMKIDIKDFKSVELQRGGLIIRGGGHLTKTMSLLTKEVTAIGSGQRSVAATYVHIRSRKPWLRL